MSILVLTSDTLSSPAAAGSFEYSSPIIVATPIGTQRGIVPTQQYYRLDTALAGANVTTAQSIFNVSATLSSSTVYEIEMVVAFNKSAGATSHTFSIGFQGTATLNNIMYEAAATSNATSYATSTASFLQTIQTATASQIFGAVASATYFNMIIVKGTVSVNAGGTFIPQYTLSAAPGGAYSTVAGSYIRINPLSASGAATNVGTWS
jgi:hypothetical protein